MSFVDCLEGAIKENKISQKRADNIREFADQLAEMYKNQDNLSPDAIRSRSEELALKSYLVQAKFNRAREADKAILLSNAVTIIKEHPSGGTVGLSSMLAKSFKGSQFNINPPVESLAEFYGNQFLAGIADIQNYFKATFWGTYSNPAMQELLVHAIHGEDVGNATISKLAGSWRALSDKIFKTARAAGIDLPYLKDWFLPQRWDATALLKLHKDPLQAAKIFADRVMPLLDRTKYTDITGNPLSDKGARTLLEEVIFPSIVTQGDSKATAKLEKRIGLRPKTTKTTVKPATEEAAIREFQKKVFGDKKGRLTSSRIIHLKDAASWLEANKMFAGQSPIQTMFSYIKSMSGEIALARTFGHDYENTFAQLLKAANARDVLEGRGTKLARDPKLLFDYLTGNALHMKGLAQMQRHKFFDTQRRLVTAAFLKSTTLTAITDFAKMTVEAHTLNAGIGRTWGNYFKLLTGSKDLRKVAQDLGIINNLLMGAVGQRFNEIADTAAQGLPSKLENLTVRASGLHRHTVSIHTALALAMNSKIADEAFVPFKSLAPSSQRTYEMFGLTEKNWDFVKQAVAVDKDVGRFVDVNKFKDDALAADPFLAEKVGSMVLFARNRAIPHNDLLIRTFMQGSYKPGDILSEVAIKGPVQFKHFFIGSLMHTIDELSYAPRAQGLEGKAAYAMIYGSAALTLGAISTQLLNIKNGKDPEDMTRPQFWMKAAAKGLGGMGVMGDLIVEADDDKWRKIASLAGGPTAMVVAGMWKIFDDVTTKPLKSLVTGERNNANTLEDIISFAQTVFPVGTFYTQLVTRRLLFDQMRKLADPDAPKAFRRQMKYAIKNGSDFWWEPGEAAPGRAPSVSNITGD